MTVEVRPYWQEWAPAPERTKNEKGELFVAVFLPYSDLNWINPKRIEADFDSIRKGEYPPPGLIGSRKDEDYYSKDDNGKLMPGNITEEVYWAVHHNLPFWRLGNIAQLALLTYSAEDERNYYAKGPSFKHTRQHHSFLVARSLEHMLEANGFNQGFVNNGIIAGMSHDIATPPYGDPTKEIDPEVLNEEVAVERILSKYDLSPLEKYGFNRDLILQAIRNEGTLGKCLDIADKISYTALDIFEYVGPIDHFENLRGERQSSGPLDSTINPIRDLLESDPKWANIYQEVRIDENKEPYFENAQRALTFIELRARMHKGLYLNPHCRGQDMLYKMLVRPLYSRDPHPNFPLNSENLLYLTDFETDKIIIKSWDFLNEERPVTSHLGVLPDYVKVKDKSEVNSKIEELEQEGLLVIGAETIRRFNPATKFRAIDPNDGQIKQIKEIFPQKAKELDEMVDYCNQTVVYYWPEDPDPESIESKRRPTISKIIEDAKKRNSGKVPSYSLY